MTFAKKISRIFPGRVFSGISLSKLDANCRLLWLALIAQVTFWFFVGQNIKPDFSITPVPPGKAEMAILSFGDDQFLYRLLAQRLQNAGDTFGETIPLKNYNYEKLQKWFYALDVLDTAADYVPSIAGMYYAQSQNPEHSRYVVDYLIDHADRDPVRKWRWYIEGVYLSVHRLHDMSLAHKIGGRLAGLDSKVVPLWARVIVPFILHRDGDLCTAYSLIKQISPEEFSEITTDKVFASRGTEHNFLSAVVMKKVKEMKENPDFLKKCAHVL
jgi:hypothetical protein